MEHKTFTLHAQLLTFDDGGYTAQITTRRLNALMQTIHCKTEDAKKHLEFISESYEALLVVFERAGYGGLSLINLILNYVNDVPVKSFHTCVRKGKRIMGEDGYVKDEIFEKEQFVKRNTMFLTHNEAN